MRSPEQYPATTAPSLSAFSQLLKVWRRLRGLSQADLSADAGVSQRQLSFLETGRSQPNRETVVALADALSLVPRDRSGLLTAAGFAPLASGLRFGDEMHPTVRHLLQMQLDHHSPLPASVVDRHWNVRMHNQANAWMFSGAGGLTALALRTGGDPRRPNLVRVTLHPLGLRDHVVNWEVLGQFWLRGLLSELTAVPDAGLESLIHEVMHYPGAPRHWREHDLAPPLPPAVPIRLRVGPREVSLLGTLSHFYDPAVAELEALRVIRYFPEDGASDLALREAVAEFTRPSRGSS